MENWTQKNIKKIEKKSSQEQSNSSSLWGAMKTKENFTRTENDALTLKSTQSKVLDLFSMGGALRKRPAEETEKMISQALSEDFLLGIKCLFYLRDIRGGQGERDTFRKGLKILSQYYPKETEKLISLIPEYGRWDDILYLEDVNIKDIILKQLKKDGESDNPSLLPKWLPSENTSSLKTKATARALRKYLGFSSKNYRMMLSIFRKRLNIIENKISTNQWNTINYSHVPSKANLKYKKAFAKHDEKRYSEFLDKVEKGEEKINTKTLFPYELVRQARDENNRTIDILWSKLPNYVKEDENALVVADVSGSMMGTPMDVSVSLAMYFAERNKGIFNNKFITFSERPELQEVQGATLNQKIKNLENAHWNCNTNLQAVFDLVLNTAVQNNTPENEMPKTIYIISDMEFDDATSGYGDSDNTNFEVINQKYKNNGYEIPQLVFWNVESRQNNVPVSQNENGVILVSGCSPVIFKMVMEKTTPYKFMLSVLNGKRYSLIEEKLK